MSAGDYSKTLDVLCACGGQLKSWGWGADCHGNPPISGVNCVKCLTKYSLREGVAVPVSNIDIENIFTYHSPTSEQIPKYEKLRAGAKEFALLIMELCPDSADRSAAIRQLRECVMTANASIALNS